MSSSPNVARRPSGILLSSPASTVRCGQIVMTTESGQVAPTESGPVSTSSEDRIPNDWWICTDDPGPTDEQLARIRPTPTGSGQTIKITVDRSNWTDFGYFSPPTSINFKVPGAFLFRLGVIVGLIEEVDRIENWKNSTFTHVYTLKVQESGA